MKSKLYSTFGLVLISCLVLSFSSCKKWLPENRVVGNWRLVEVQKRRLLDRETIYTGYENGIFAFNNNNSASFTDPSDTLTGTWSMRRTNAGYYDSNDNWQSEGKTIFIIHVYDFVNNRLVDWYFDWIDFRSSGDKLFGFIQGPSYTYRYDFRKQ